jgi:opacity protein-like surface antigen
LNTNYFARSVTMKELRGSWRWLGRLFLALLFLSLLSLPTMAQDKAELFGGYQFARISGVDLNGWEAALTGNLNHWFGVTGDFSGAYCCGGSGYTFMGGPVISEGRTLKPFVHALFGGFHASANGFGIAASANGFAMAVGGGLDVKAARHMAIRVGQVDWFMLRANGGSLNRNVRYSAGIVFRF